MRFRLTPMGASRRAVNSEAAGQRATVFNSFGALECATPLQITRRSHEWSFVFPAQKSWAQAKPSLLPALALRVEALTSSHLVATCGNQLLYLNLPTWYHLMLLHNSLVSAFPGRATGARGNDFWDGERQTSNEKAKGGGCLWSRAGIWEVFSPLPPLPPTFFIFRRGWT